MKAAGVSQIEVLQGEDGKHLSFLVYSVGLGVSGRSKSIEYGAPDCYLVDDTDAALAQAGGASCVAKRLDRHWYIRATD
jgi:hypothetical protein